MFNAARQVSSARYEVHLFATSLHFKAWMQVHKPRDMRPASQAHGSKQGEVNHIGEMDLAVDLKETELECAA